MKMKNQTEEFIINEHSICTNPIREVIADNRKYRLKISYACNPDGDWSYGFDFQQLYGYFHGSSSGVGFSSRRDIFQSKDEARTAAIQRGIKWCVRHDDAMKHFQIALTPQLTLF